MPLMNIFTFLTSIRPLAIPSDVSAALLKHSFTFVAIYADEGYSNFYIYADEGYSILTETFRKVFLVSDD